MCFALMNTSPRISEDRGPTNSGVARCQRRWGQRTEEFTRGIQCDIRTEELPLSMHSTYTIQRRGKVTGKWRKHNGRHSKGTTDDKRMSKAYGTEGNDKRSTDQ